MSKLLLRRSVYLTDEGREFVNTGYDKSLRPEEPSHPSTWKGLGSRAALTFPVIFTKRATSIIPSGAQIYPHPKVTQKLDYEGELGIIIGKGGIGIRKEDAWKHVWGAVIINDASRLTAPLLC